MHPRKNVEDSNSIVLGGDVIMNRTVKNKRRMFHLIILFVLVWMILIYRLLDIQLLHTKDFSSHHINLLAKSIEQRKEEFILSNGRGDIYDRHLESLLEQREIRTVILFPFIKQAFDINKIHILAKILNMDSSKLIEQIKGLIRPTYLKEGEKPVEITVNQQREIERLAMPGIVPSIYTIENPQQISAKHVIGYLGQAPEVIVDQFQEYLDRGILNRDSMIGRSGLQRTFQEILMGIGESKLAYFVDNIGRPLNGLSYQYQNMKDDYYPLSLVTTIDKKIQRIAEKQLKNAGVEEGSIVILDAANADILAMASVPDFDINHVDPYSPNWNNKAVQVIEPGSIFKTVIAIAGLEEKVVTPHEVFFCNDEWSTYHFPCDIPEEGITLEEGYAKSRNGVFAKIGKRLGPEQMLYYAEQLRMVGTVGWEGPFFKKENFKQIGDEEQNRIFHPNTNLQDTGAVLRTAIGQQDVRISPLAAANLVVTILHDGTVFEPRLVSKVIYKNGTDYYQFPVQHANKRVGKRETYQTIRSMMKMVVDEGTGQILKQAKWKLAGKSGTAETSNNKNNQWFIGYGPVENPRYAVAVAINRVSTNRPLAKQVFMGIMDQLAKW